MSANTSIKEGGTPFPFGPVKALLVEGSDGKYDPWVPESERQLGYKSIDKNGIYRASDDGVYGWGSVSVSVSQATSVTGRDPDTGEEVVVRPDPETGDIVKTVVPVEIRVTTPPTKVTYVDGEAIDYSGIVVHAYSATGQDMGAVTSSDLVFPVSTAYNESGQSYATSDLDTGNFTQPIPLTGVIINAYSYTAGVGPIRDSNTFTPVGGAALVVMSNKIGATNILFASANNGEALTRMRDSIKINTGEQQKTIHTFSTTNSYTRDDKTVYYGSHSFNWNAGHDHVINPTINSYGGSNRQAEAAWTAIYGTIIGENQSLPVQWSRTGDGAVLETAFDITVTGGN